MDPAVHNRLVAIVGATASGKSDAAVLLAQRFDGEIINADSRLFYRGMEIGTARPPQTVLELVPHHLVDFLDPNSRFNLAEFLTVARKLIDEIQHRGKLPILVGGTGQYVWGLLEGWQVPGIPPNESLREELEQELALNGVVSLFGRLEAQAPEVAAEIDRQNHRRVIRALERIASGYDKQVRTAVDPGYKSVVVGLKVGRPELHLRVVNRIDAMLANGWLDEVKALIDDGVDLSSSALTAIGYREIAASLAGELTLDEARERTIRATNRLIRHQNNWFKQTDNRIHWVDVSDGDLSRIAPVVARLITPASS